MHQKSEVRKPNCVPERIPDNLLFWIDSATVFHIRCVTRFYEKHILDIWKVVGQ